MKIRSEYCMDDKVQLMLSNAPSQIIFSSDDIICFKNYGKKIIYTYNKDLGINILPYCDVPESKYHLNHLFDYGKPYVQFTSNIALGPSLRVDSDSYSLEFLFFTKSLSGVECKFFNASEIGKTKFFVKTDAEGVSKFLKKQPDEDARYIFNDFWGIEYVDTKIYGNLVDQYKVDLDDDSILKNYISSQNLFSSYSVNSYNVLSDGNSNVIDDIAVSYIELPQDINQVPPHIISPGIFDDIVMFVSKDGELFYVDFDIKFLRSNEFLIEGYRGKVTVPMFYRSDMEEYGSDPHYLDDKSAYPILPLLKDEQISNYQKAKGKILSIFRR